MKEILPGVFHWTRMHPKIGIEVSSYWLRPERVLLDPLVPDAGLDAFDEAPEHVLLTNRHHWRESDRFVERFGCTVWCSEPGLHEFADGREVRGFRFGDELPGGVLAIEIDGICPDETALFVARESGIVAVADGVIRDGEGPLRFVTDDFMGDDPPAVKNALRRAYGRLLDRRFDHLLLAHGCPWIGGARQALADFVQR